MNDRSVRGRPACVIGRGAAGGGWAITYKRRRRRDPAVRSALRLPGETARLCNVSLSGLRHGRSSPAHTYVRQGKGWVRAHMSLLSRISWVLAGGCGLVSDVAVPLFAFLYIFWSKCLRRNEVSTHYLLHFVIWNEWRWISLEYIYVHIIRFRYTLAASFTWKNKLLSSYKGKKQMAGCINMKFSLIIACTVHMYSQKPKEFSHLLTIFYLTHHMYSQKPK